MISFVVEGYIDLFILWLLYRFVKPKKTLGGGKMEASTFMYALVHD